MRNSFRIVTPKVIAGLPGTWLPISVIIKDSISEGGGIGLASVGIANGMEFPARHLGAIKIAIFIIANGRWCKKCRLIGFHGQRAISVLLAKQWPGLHPNGGNRLSHIREPELFCRFSHLPQFSEKVIPVLGQQEYQSFKVDRISAGRVAIKGWLCRESKVII